MTDDTRWWLRSKATGFFFCPECIVDNTDFSWAEKVVPRQGKVCCVCGGLSPEQLTSSQAANLKAGVWWALANAPPGSDIYLHPRDAASFVPVIHSMEIALTNEIHLDHELPLGTVRIMGEMISATQEP